MKATDISGGVRRIGPRPRASAVENTEMKPLAESTIGQVKGMGGGNGPNLFPHGAPSPTGMASLHGTPRPRITRCSISWNGLSIEISLTAAAGDGSDPQNFFGHPVGKKIMNLAGRGGREGGRADKQRAWRRRRRSKVSGSFREEEQRKMEGGRKEGRVKQ